MKEREITRTIARQNRWRAMTAVSSCLIGEGLMYAAFSLMPPINFILFFCSTLVLLMSVMTAWSMGVSQRHDILVTAKGMSHQQLGEYIRHLSMIKKELEDEDSAGPGDE
jgi:hypothetical protein